MNNWTPSLGTSTSAGLRPSLYEEWERQQRAQAAYRRDAEDRYWKRHAWKKSSRKRTGRFSRLKALIDPQFSPHQWAVTPGPWAWRLQDFAGGVHHVLPVRRAVRAVGPAAPKTSEPKLARQPPQRVHGRYLAHLDQRAAGIPFTSPAECRA